MGNGKMLILPGNGGTYEDEDGDAHDYGDNGALHQRAAKAFATKRQYVPSVLDIAGNNQSAHSKQAKEVMKRFLGLKYDGYNEKKDPAEIYTEDEKNKAEDDIHAFYGFSGGAINLSSILKYIAKRHPDDLSRISLVVAIGGPERPEKDYRWQTYKEEIKDKVDMAKWKKEQWEKGWNYIYNTNPIDEDMQKLKNYDQLKKKKVSRHMYGPDILEVLDTNWPVRSG